VAGVYSPAALIARPAGLGLGLASGLAFAAYTLFGKGATRVGRRSSLSIMFYIFFFAAVSLLLWGVPAEGAHLFSPALDAWGWCLMIGLTMGPTLGGYLCFTSCLRYLSATVASLFTTLELPVAALLAFVILGRALSVLQWLGAALIVIGVLIVQISSTYQSR
jgi:drug/metabolite transporter (DMT)-like permease